MDRWICIGEHFIPAKSEKTCTGITALTRSPIFA